MIKRTCWNCVHEYDARCFVKEYRSRMLQGKGGEPITGEACKCWWYSDKNSKEIQRNQIEAGKQQCKEDKDGAGLRELLQRYGL